MKIAELCVAAVVQRLFLRERERAAEVKPDPERTARIRAYTARTMNERYGEHGPP